MKKEITVKRYNNGHITEQIDSVIVEEYVELIINNQLSLSISMSPDDPKAFAYGFLLTSGLISSPNQVQKVNIQNNTINISLNHSISDVKLFLPSGCGGGPLVETNTDTDSELPRKPFKQPLMPPLDKLTALFKKFNRYSVVFEETGGNHSAALSDLSHCQSIKFFSEDIGRHNAVDKVIGKALLQNTDFNSHFLLTSGRISAEIVKKTVYAGLRAIVSRSAPTCAAIVRARRAKITIIGFLRGNRFNIYT